MISARNPMDQNRIYQIVGVAVVGLLAGGGGSVAVDAISPPRPDPFTATMAREMRADLLAAIAMQELRIRALEAGPSPFVQRLDQLSEALRDMRQELREQKPQRPQ